MPWGGREKLAESYGPTLIAATTSGKPVLQGVFGIQPIGIFGPDDIMPQLVLPVIF